MHLSKGPLVQVALLDLGPDTPPRLLLILHHLLVDGVSWRILLADLDLACRQLLGGQPVELPPKTTSFKYWAQRLSAYAQSDALRSELAYWLADARTQGAPLPVDSEAGANSQASTGTVEVSLSVAETEALLHQVPKAYQTEINRRVADGAGAGVCGVERSAAGVGGPGGAWSRSAL